MQPPAAERRRIQSNPRIRITVQLDLFRTIIKVMAVLSAINWIVCPIVQHDESKVAIWRIAKECPGGAPTVVSITVIVCSLLLIAIWVHRIRACAGVMYAMVMATWAFLPFQGTFSFSLMIISMAGVALTVLGAEVVD